MLRHLYHLKYREVCFTQNYHTRQVKNNVFRLISKSNTEFNKRNPYNLVIEMCNQFDINISSFNNCNY